MFNRKYALLKAIYTEPGLNLCFQKKGEKTEMESEGGGGGEASKGE